MEAQQTVAALKELQELRGSHAVAYLVDQFAHDDVYPLYECLRSIGHVEHLDVVLHTGGGDVDLTRRIALLLHEFTDDLRILVPDHAESAGTLLCLSAHELVLGPMSRLGPIDPHLSSAGDNASPQPPRISSQDIKAFPEMAAEWFGMDRTADRLQAFSAVSQRMFPTTMSSFYRNDKNVRRAGRELFAFQRADLDDEDRGRVVDHLVSGYDSHNHVITRAEAAQLGLRVSNATTQEEASMWECTQISRDQYPAELTDGDMTLGVIASSKGFQARHVLTGGLSGAPGTQMPLARWMIDSTPGESLGGSPGESPGKGG